MLFAYCPIHWHSSLYFKSDIKNLHCSVHLFLHPHLTNSLHMFKACGKSVNNGIISFSTFCQHHWQASEPSKSLNKDCRHFEDWMIDLRTCCLSVPLVGGIFSITFLLLENRIRLASVPLCCKFLNIILPQKIQVFRIHYQWFCSVLRNRRQIFN